jgi:hypothetical protein
MVYFLPVVVESVLRIQNDFVLTWIRFSCVWNLSFLIILLNSRRKYADDVKTVFRIRIGWIRIQSGQWIRIRKSDPEAGSRIRIQESKNDALKEMFSFEGRRLL